jgi:hypothetical protein
MAEDGETERIFTQRATEAQRTRKGEAGTMFWLLHGEEGTMNRAPTGGGDLRERKLVGCGEVR